MSEIPDTVLGEAMHIDKNNDGLLDAPEISEALNALSPFSRCTSKLPSEQDGRETIDQGK
jgi:hypothetical protein